MKRILWIPVLLTLVLTACGGNGSTGVIGGADGPTKIIVSGPEGSGTFVTGEDPSSESGAPAPEGAEAESAGEGTALTEEELAAYTEFLNRIDANSFLLTNYETPTEANLYEIFFSGAGMDREPTDAEREAFLAYTGWEELYTDLQVIPADALDSLLQARTDLPYERWQEAGNELDMVYLPEFDAYFQTAGYPNYSPVEAVSGVRYPNGTVVVESWEQDLEGTGLPDTFTTTFREQEHGYPLFVANRVSGGWRAAYLDEQDADSLELTAARPPFGRFAPADAVADDTLPVTLDLLSKRDNGVTFAEDWEAEHWLEWMGDPDFAAVQDFSAEALMDQDRWYVYDCSDGETLTVVSRESGETVLTVDFSAYLYPEGYSVMEPDLEGLDAQVLRWARIVNGVLYVSHSHRTYASSTNGNNAYLTAVSLESGEVLWRSDPLVSNAGNFEILGVEDEDGTVREGVILTGYGFTAEDDYIYQISLETGKLLTRTKVDSQPDRLVYVGGTLYVHCYNRDYTFAVSFG